MFGNQPMHPARAEPERLGGRTECSVRTPLEVHLAGAASLGAPRLAQRPLDRPPSPEAQMHQTGRMPERERRGADVDVAHPIDRYRLACASTLPRGGKGTFEGPSRTDPIAHEPRIDPESNSGLCKGAVALALHRHRLRLVSPRLREHPLEIPSCVQPRPDHPVGQSERCGRGTHAAIGLPAHRYRATGALHRRSHRPQHFPPRGPPADHHVRVDSIRLGGGGNARIPHTLDRHRRGELPAASGAFQPRGFSGHGLPPQKVARSPPGLGHFRIRARRRTRGPRTRSRAPRPPRQP